MRIIKSIPRRLSALAVALLLMQLLHAQNIGINADGFDPDDSAILDVYATNKGLLIPRVSLSSTTDVTTITTPATSLLVYNTNAAITGTGANGEGFYYWNGSNWVNLMVYGAAVSDHDWYRVGTTDAPTAITDTMFHIGNMGIGKNTANHPIDLFSASATIGINDSIGGTHDNNKSCQYNHH